MSNGKVADRRTVVANEANGEGAGVIVAAGDPLPDGAVVSGYLENTPNRVDAAANYETVDAADRALNPTPAGPLPVKPQFGNIASVDATTEETRKRVAEGTAEHDAELQRLADEANGANGGGADEPEPETPSKPADMTVAQLDARYGETDGYPRGGNKAEKVKFATKADKTSAGAKE